MNIGSQCRTAKWGPIAGVLSLFLTFLSQANPSFQQSGNTLVISNANVTINYDLSAGTANFFWQKSQKISAFYAGVTLSSGYVESVNFSNRTWSVVNSNEVAVTAFAAGMPEMIQYFTLDQTDSFLTRVAMRGTSVSANWMGPMVVDATGGVDIGSYDDDVALCVPFDNDGFVSYNAISINNSSNSYEVGAFYDNTTRNGLVVGSVTHDIWKSGVYFNGSNNRLDQMNVYGGATTPADVMPHGAVTGNFISSPTIFVGFGSDWRQTLEEFAAENTKFAPRLAWTNGVPFGWNSWGVFQQNINYNDAIAVSDFVHTNLEPNGFTNRATAYINLDAFWNNLDSFQLQSFVNHCHALGQKAGIYFGPFAWFGSVANATNTFVEGSSNTYHYSDILLRDDNGQFESADGGLAIDPTHPGDKELIQYYVNLYTNYGFDYIKLDFLSHGALEGVHHDPNVTTGIEAYNEGMSNVLSAINGRMFMSESIAPLFPYQYADSRRIACDAQTSLIANTAYMMNSVTYGWWLDNLYQFNDPDIMVFNGYGATTNENQSRLISGAVTGIFLDGDDLTSTNGQLAAQMRLTNPAIDTVARVGRTFTPVEGNTGTGAANIFVRQDGPTWSVAVFNYSAGPTNITVDLARAGLPAGDYVAENIWDETTTNVSGSFNISLNAKQAKLFQLSVESLTWQMPANISGTSDVSTQGTYFGSWAPYSASPLTVNGVTFQNFTDLPGFSYTGFNAGYNYFPDAGTVDTNYDTLLESGAYEYPGPACTFSWDGMTPGHTYLVEFWVNGNVASRTETLSGGTNSSATINYEPGQYIVGQFVANAPGAETITLNGEAADNHPQVNLLQVRDITVAATSVPMITSAQILGGNLIFVGTSGRASGVYYVLTTTNLALPLASWTPIATNVYDPSGNLSATNLLIDRDSQQFYTIKQP
jgi:hypothetical protein